MHITELRLAGFKSFVDPVRAPIEPGLTGVVGPNGCGKSNLLEAVRWVMGASSAKAMRAEEMDDVIFAGSGVRPAREHAEVTLVLSDAAGAAPGALASADVLEVSRRIKRGAGSTYRINGKEVRAKDAQLLFADAATGANSPALVRQGQVSDLIASKPENRRRILEEAAGIAGLHARRHEADLKLRAAETNLSRLDEILLEIEAQAANLKKQARQAERYRGLAESMRQTEALLLHRRWSEAREALAESEAAVREAERCVAEAAARASAAARDVEAAREALPPLREEEAIASAVLRRLEGVRVGLERDLAEADAAIARADAESKRATEDIERAEMVEADAQTALERLDAESASLGSDDEGASADALRDAERAANAADVARRESEAALEARAAEVAAARARSEALARTADGAKLRVKRLEERRASLDMQINALPIDDALAAKRGEAEAAATAAQAESNRARVALNEAEAALKAAEKADEAAWTPYRAAESAERALTAEMRGLEKLAPPEGGKFAPVLASIEVDEGYERALAAALGDDLDASLNAEAPARWAGADAKPVKWPAGVAPLAPHVKAPEALSARLAMVGVVADSDGGKLIAQMPAGVRLVSQSGALWRWDGFVRRADAPAPAAAKLEHKNRLEAARKEAKRAAEKLAKTKQAHEEARAARQKAETLARTLRADAPKHAVKAADAVRVLERLDEEIARSAERRAALTGERAALESELTEAKAALSEMEAPSPEALPDMTDVRAAAEAARTQAAEARAALEGLKREGAARKARREAVAAERADWQRRGDAAKERRVALEAELARIAKARAAAADAPEAARAKLATLMDEAGTAEARRKRASDAAAAAETAAREAEVAARNAENAHSEAREKRAGAAARQAASEERLAGIVQQALEATQSAPEALADLAGAMATGPLAKAPLNEIERRLDRLRAERDAGGPVNLRADEELAEAEGRLATLNAEKADVAAGIAKLRGAITRLNNEGRARLAEAFQIVDANFGKLFATLFEGGQAALKLTENEDPLMAGLEIYAQPPGKKLSALSLMSGGEQALTATALIFAVFLANPAPLCVLDEVDAPLDDANVDRFCRMLEEMKRLTSTRFIAITHNPVTMSRMDRLYGVTMAEQGVSQLVSVDLGRAKELAGAA